jgi:probable rRNA maturation factor
MSPAAPELEITVLDRQRARQVDCRLLGAFLDRAAGEVPPGAPSVLTVCLVSDRRMRELNRTFRNKDAPTDVLSFPGEPDPEPDGVRHLGDIVIAVQSAARQARQRCHSFGRELKILALHGYLHLLGFDHESDDGEMMRLQRRLERRLLPQRAPRRKPGS